MTTNIDDAADLAPKKNGRYNQANGVTYHLNSDKRGFFFHHPQHGRVKVVALFCNCGRSILVRAVDAKGSSIMCRLCNSPFIWQQLTFNSE